MTREALEGGGELVLVDLPCEREGLVLESMAAILKDVLPGGGGESGAASVAAPRAELQVYRPDPPSIIQFGSAVAQCGSQCCGMTDRYGGFVVRPHRLYSWQCGRTV